MSLFQIAIFAVFALLVALLRRGPGRIALETRTAAIRWLLLAASVLAIYSLPCRCGTWISGCQPQPWG